MKIDAYEIKAGQTFEVDGRQYTAVRNATGEFRPYIMVENGNADGTGPGEIVLYHGQQVDLIK